MAKEVRRNRLFWIFAVAALIVIGIISYYNIKTDLFYQSPPVNLTCCLCAYQDEESRRFCDGIWSPDCDIKREVETQSCGDLCSNLGDSVRSAFSGLTCGEYKIYYAGHSSWKDGFEMLAGGYNLCIEESCSVYFHNTGCSSLKAWPDVLSQLRQLGSSLPPNVSLTLSGNQDISIARGGDMLSCANSLVTLSTSCEPDFDECNEGEECFRGQVGERKICTDDKGVLKALECCRKTGFFGREKWKKPGCGDDSDKCTRLAKFSGKEWGTSRSYPYNIILSDRKNLEICTEVRESGSGGNMNRRNEDVGSVLIIENQYIATCEEIGGIIYITCSLDATESRILSKTSCSPLNTIIYTSSGQCIDASFATLGSIVRRVDGSDETLINWGGDIDGFQEGILQGRGCEPIISPIYEQHTENQYIMEAGCGGDDNGWYRIRTINQLSNTGGNQNSPMCGM